MPQKAQSIEVEVVEIDGAAPPATFTRREPAPPPRQGQDLHGRIRRLNSRWWPLWVLLGVVVVSIVLTFGVLFGIALLVFLMIQRMIRALIR